MCPSKGEPSSFTRRLAASGTSWPSSWALRSPGRLIGSVGDARKAELPNAIGVHSVVSTQGDWVGDLLALTDGAPPDVIFDAIGGAVSRLGLSNLSIGGHFVAYGGASGEYAALSKEDMPSFVMSGKSLLGYSLVPLLGRKDAARYLQDDLDTLFSYVTQGVLRPHVGHHFPLHEAADAHRLIESRRSSGKIILLAGGRPKTGCRCSIGHLSRIRGAPCRSLAAKRNSEVTRND